MTEQEFMRAELLGRFRVIYECQMKEPESIVVSMPLKYHYDLQWRHTDGTREYIEVKNRECKSDQYKTAMFNIEKVDNNEKFGDNFRYVATYTDKKSIWFTPTMMPESGITYGYGWIKKTSIDPNSPRIKQKRVYYNTNDLDFKENCPIIEIYDDYDEQPNS